MSDWMDYSKQQPDSAGVYEWMVPSQYISGLSVTFYCHMRMRGAGFREVLSPVFDRWDGYRVIVPEGTSWRKPKGRPPNVEKFECKGVSIPALKVAPCPFCKTVPQWRGVNRTRNGVLLSAKPNEFNIWWLKCCQFAQTPHTDDPVAMVENRNNLLAPITRLTAAHRHAAEELQVVRASREQCQAEIFNLKDEIEAEQFQGVEDDLEITRLKSEIERLREALRQIANGDGYYGAQAREYKEIARRSLSSLSGVGASADQTAVP